MCVSEFRSPSHISGLNRSASLNYTDRSESQSISGSNTQLNSSPSAQYVPDFNMRALTDLQIVKVRMDTIGIPFTDYTNRSLGLLFFEALDNINKDIASNQVKYRP